MRGNSGNSFWHASLQGPPTLQFSSLSVIGEVPNEKGSQLKLNEIKVSTIASAKPGDVSKYR